ncbi:MAG: hypothetical protein SOZ43_02560, partial [Eubacteriales bacterium]|nr:hypothetical protein [Eubacteriales bacterium]
KKEQTSSRAGNQALRASVKASPAGQGFPACRSPKFVHRKNFGGSPSSLKVKATDTAFRFPLKSQYRLPLKIYLGGVASANFLMVRRNRLFA